MVVGYWTGMHEACTVGGNNFVKIWNCNYSNFGVVGNIGIGVGSNYYCNWVGTGGGVDKLVCSLGVVFVCCLGSVGVGGYYYFGERNFDSLCFEDSHVECDQAGYTDSSFERKR